MTIFNSGLAVVKSSSRHENTITFKILDLLKHSASITATEYAKIEKCSVLVAKEELLVI
jgi:hypothetical protein